MTDAMKIINTIIADWWLIGFFFTLGGLWWQGKAWFNGVNQKLNDTAETHEQQNKILTDLTNKVSNIEQRVERMDNTLTRVHEESHELELKLAVLENSPRTRKARKSAQ